jgi:Spy/CpxP family protein refolding chaperone
MNARILIGALMMVSGFGFSPAWADESHGRASGERGHEAAMHHEGAGHYIRHLLKHPKEIGLTADLVSKLKAIKLDLDRVRIRAEAEIQVAEIELAALVEDEKADLTAIESKVKQSETLEIGLRVAAIKAKRDAMALLTPEQREKEKAEHEKMMRQMSGGHGGGMGGGMMGGGMMGGSGHGGPPPAAPQKEERRH